MTNPEQTSLEVRLSCSFSSLISPGANTLHRDGSSSICVEVVPARLAKLLIRRTNFDQVASVLPACCSP